MTESQYWNPRTQRFETLRTAMAHGADLRATELSALLTAPFRALRRWLRRLGPVSAGLPRRAG